MDDDEDLPLEAQPGLAHGRGHVARRGCTCQSCAIWRQENAFHGYAQERDAEARERRPERATPPPSDAFEPPRFHKVGGRWRVVAPAGACQARTRVMVWRHSREDYVKRYLTRRLGQQKIQGRTVDVFGFDRG